MAFPPKNKRSSKIMSGSTVSCPCSLRGGAHDSISRAHILRDHCYCEAVHTSATEQSKLDLGGDSLQTRGRVGVRKLTPTCGQAWEPSRRLRSGLPPDQRKGGTNAPLLCLPVPLTRKVPALPILCYTEYTVLSPPCAHAHTGHCAHCCAQGAPADMAQAAGAHTRVHAPLPRARALCGLCALLS